MGSTGQFNWRDVLVVDGTSTQLIEKELYMHLIAYNLIRCLMAEAAILHEMPLDRISFKGTLDTLLQYSPLIASASSRKKRDMLLYDMIKVLALDELPWRPNRVEPHATKRRPKPYALLNKPRKQMIVIPHRSKCRKNKGLN